MSRHMVRALGYDAQVGVRWLWDLVFVHMSVSDPVTCGNMQSNQQTLG